MLSKNKIKLLKSLALKKFRQKENLFLVEGDKNVSEVLDSGYKVNEVYATGTFLNSNERLAKQAGSVYEISAVEIKKISLLSHPQNAVALCSLPVPDNAVTRLDRFCLFLDDIQDPGNMGTIIRICDWFGIGSLYCSPSTVDIYNPKVIQASMGSFCRVKTIYIPFMDLYNTAVEPDFPVFGTFPEGNSIYKEKLPEKGLVIMGNEGRGISPEAAEKVSYRLAIPSFSEGTKRAESLNVAVAAGIICSEFKRRIFDNAIQNGSKV